MPDFEADADIGFSTEFHRHDGEEPGQFIQVGQVVDLTPPNLSRETVDVTHHQSPKRFREFVGALLDAGEMSFSVQMSGPGVMSSFIKDMTEKKALKYKMVWPDGVEWPFAGLVTGVTPEAPIDDKMMAGITIKLSGVPDFVEAATALAEPVGE